MTFSTTVTIDGVDVTSNYVSEYEVVDTTNEVTPANIIAKSSINSIINFEQENEVIITRTKDSTTQYVFRGYVGSIKKVQGLFLNFECYDKLWKLKRLSLTKTYDLNIDSQAGVISEIAKDIIETYGGLTASVVSTGTVNVLDKFYALNDNLFDLLQQLSDLVDYDLYYDPTDDKIHFQPKGYESSTTTLIVGNNISNVPVWEYDYTKIANIITVTGDYQELETTETFTGDGAETEFTLSYTPESVKVYVTDTLQVGGVTGQSTTFDYSVDKENKKIIFEAGSIPPAAADNIEVRYSYLEPIVVSQKNPESRTKYGDYTVNKFIDTIKTTEDAELKVNEIKTKFSEPPVSTTLEVINTYTLKAGMMVTVVDSVNNEEREMPIKNYTYKYPKIIDEVVIDNSPIYEDYVAKNKIRERINRLERKNQSRGNLINQLFGLDHQLKPRRRYQKVQKQSIAGDTLIWGHPTYGIWGSFNWGGTAQTSFILGSPSYGVLGTSKLGSQTSSAITIKLVQGNMTYQEDCHDTDFHDAVNSTATFSTVTKDISFTSGQVWYSNVIDLGTTLSYVTLTLGTTTGTLKLEISSDNKSTWQELTNATRTAVTTSDGTGTYIRITENNSTTATIDNTYDSYGRLTVYGITLKMEE